MAERQFDRELSVEQKKQIILDRLAQEQHRWHDLNFSIDALTGINERQYVTYPPATAQYWPWNSFMSQLSASGMRWFIDIHDAGHLSAALNVWPNARIIRFVNSDNFLKWRKVNYSRQALQSFWQTIRDHDWPDHAPETWEEFCQLDDDIKTELLFVRHGDIFRYIQHPESQQAYAQAIKEHQDQVCANRPVFEFDTDVLLDTTEYTKTMVRLYQWIDLNDFDKDFIECYHKQWLEKIQQVPI